MRRVAVGIAMLMLTSCGAGSSSGTSSLPPPGSSSVVVMRAYLRALAAGDCTTAHALAASTFTRGNGELCGDVEVSAYSLDGPPARPERGEVAYAAELTTGGSRDGSIEAGTTTWFYDLERRDGEWRLVSGGSGP